MYCIVSINYTICLDFYFILPSLITENINLFPAVSEHPGTGNLGQYHTCVYHVCGISYTSWPSNTMYLVYLGVSYGMCFRNSWNDDIAQWICSPTFSNLPTEHTTKGLTGTQCHSPILLFRARGRVRGQVFWDLRICHFSVWDLRKQDFKCWEMIDIFLMRSEKWHCKPW